MVNITDVQGIWECVYLKSKYTSVLDFPEGSINSIIYHKCSNVNFNGNGFKIIGNVLNLSPGDFIPDNIGISGITINSVGAGYISIVGELYETNGIITGGSAGYDFGKSAGTNVQLFKKIFTGTKNSLATSVNLSIHHLYSCNTSLVATCIRDFDNSVFTYVFEKHSSL